jgi:molybdopterin/thiamine biosynthesis adenylyltransferase
MTTDFSAARVLVVGVGGLGCPAAIVLVRAGVGVLGIADDDEVHVSNLHRQILFDDADVGRPKAPAAARALARLGATRIEVHGTRLLPSNAVSLVERYDVVVEGSDNFATKFLTADACALAKRPVVHGAAVRWHGTALAVGAYGRPCYRCIFEDLPLEDAPNCAEAGVVGPMVGVVAAAQADLALSVLAGEDVTGELFTFDGKSMAVRRRRSPPRRSCPLCGDAVTIDSIDARRYVEGCLSTHAPTPKKDGKDESSWTRS